MAKKKIGKLKSNKLEDRIAPGMLGGGIIDPGMVEAVEVEVETQEDENAGNIAETQSEQLSADGENGGQGEYLDDNASSGTMEADQPADASLDQPVEGDNVEPSTEEFDEFAKSDADAGQPYEPEGVWQEADWVDANPDGGMHVEPPEGVLIEDGTASFPHDIANEALPLPDEMEVQPDGSMNIQMPEGAEYLEGSNAFIMPEGSFDPEQVPENIQSFENPDGSYTVSLPAEGFEYNPETNVLNVDNYHVNEMTPDNVTFNTDGSVDVHLPPEGVEYHEDGSFDMSPEACHHMDNPPPEYLGEVDYANYNPDGSVTFEPPEGVEVEDGIATVPYDMIDEHLPLDDDYQINADGTSNYTLPEGTDYNADAHTLTFPEGAMHVDEIPEEIDAHKNPDGSITACLPEGIDYDAESNSVHMDNYWSNELAPDNMAINEDGSVSFALPEETEFYEDGSFNVPADQLDFVDATVPEYVGDVDFAESTESGDYHVNPPEGFTVDSEQGELHIQHDQIDSLPIPDEVNFNPDGTMDVQVPEGTTYNETYNSLQFPAGSVHLDEIPPEVEPVLHDDGSITINLQDGMEYNPDSGSVQLDNYWTNEVMPEAVEYTPEGEMHINLPDDCEFHEDGSFTLPEESTDFMENPDPGYVANGPDWIEANPDGSVTVEKVDEIKIDPENGTMQMNTDYMAEQFDQQIPDEVHFNPDGTMDVQVPEGTNFNPDTGNLTFPEGTVHLEEIPEGVEAHMNPDGSITARLPDGMEFNAETQSVHMDNYWTNEFTPEHVEIHPDGYCEVKLPSETHYFDDGSCQIPAEQADFIDDPAPGYVEQGPDWVHENPDGSVSVQPPEGVHVDAENGQVTMSLDTFSESFGDEFDDAKFNPDGTIDYPLPEGTEYNPEANSLRFPAGEMHMNEIPEQMDAHVNPDGSITLSLPEGVDYNEDTGGVHLDNYWANELSPSEIEINTDGTVTINLPPETQYFEDGSFTMPDEHKDFCYEDKPEYVGDFEHCEQMESGDYHVKPPEGFNVDPETGEMHVPYDQMGELPIPDDVHFNPDGSMDVKLPEGTDYNPELNQLKFPEGSVHIDEIPPEVKPELHEDGTITVNLQDGMQYDAESGDVHLDNYWANEVMPDHCEYTPEGEMVVNLPGDCQYYEDGSFRLPEESADFMNNPEPGYVMDGPEWVNENPDGSVSFASNEGMKLDPETGTMHMETEYMSEQFDQHIPDEVHFNPDGTMDVKIPEGTEYDAESRSLTFPEGSVHMNEIPEQVEAHLNDDGTITATLPDGMDYNAEAGSVHMDNYWTNEFTPDNMEIHPDGHCEIHMPQGTEYYDDGSCSVPPEHADFIENPGPEYVDQGPDWVTGNPDGSITVSAPEGATVDPEAGTMTMSVDQAMNEFEIDDVKLNADGTADFQLPEGTEYNAEANALTFPAGEVHLDEFPEGLQTEYHPDGTISLTLPEGIDYDAEAGSVHVYNEWLNEMAPDAIEITPAGEFVVHLPEGTEYFEDGQFVVQAEHADFIDGGEHHEGEHHEGEYHEGEHHEGEQHDDGPEWANENPDGSITVDAPEGAQVDPEAGTMTMSVDQAVAEFHIDDVTFHSDGSADFQLPEGATFDAEANSLTFPADEFQASDFPEQVEVTYNPDGSATVSLPEGIDCDPEAGIVHLNNAWVNEFAPEPIEITPDGQFVVHLPEGTEFHEDGQFVIPADQANFMDDHHEEAEPEKQQAV